jgi:hypothetical protein
MDEENEWWQYSPDTLLAWDPSPLPRRIHQILERKRRLFACACCRYFWNSLPELGRKALEVCERYADGLADEDELLAANQSVHAAWPRPVPEWDYFEGAPDPNADWDAFREWSWARGNEQSRRQEELTWAAGPGVEVARWIAAWEPTKEVASHTAEAVRRASFPNEGAPGETQSGRLLGAWRHDLFDGYGRPVTISPAWLSWNDGTVVKLARTIYDDRGFEDLPVLADALEDAGCTDEAILGHCRGPGPHVRGCWVVDLLLGKG